MAQKIETIAAIRFGYGFRAGEQDISDTEQLLAQLQGPDKALNRFSGPDYRERRRVHKAYRKQVNKYKKRGVSVKRDLKTAKRAFNSVLLADVNRRFSRAILSPDGFRERLASFWQDHFTVVPKGQGQAIQYGDFIDTAIRPHLAGRFAEILIAVTLHPSMLSFLDQNRSVGPNSKAGKRHDRGLNENLAREVLELHTMGVGASYSQKDVRQLAELLTGLSVTDHGMEFKHNIAEPGAETVLGHSYGGGNAQVSHIIAFLEDVSVHPQTARHITYKLAVHFIADEPDVALLAHMEQAYLRSGGDLQTVYAAMLEHRSAWGNLGQKVKQPFGFITSGFRALNVAPKAIVGRKPGQVRKMFALPMVSMGQPMRRAPGPNGWPEEAEAWITPQGLAARLQWALVASTRYGGGLDPRDFVEASLRDVAGQTLRFAVAASEKRAEGLALVLASPEFNRR